jgi:hypothetical protein
MLLADPSWSVSLVFTRQIYFHCYCNHSRRILPSIPCLLLLIRYIGCPNFFGALIDSYDNLKTADTAHICKQTVNKLMGIPPPLKDLATPNTKKFPTHFNRTVFPFFRNFSFLLSNFYDSQNVSDFSAFLMCFSWFDKMSAEKQLKQDWTFSYQAPDQMTDHF